MSATGIILILIGFAIAYALGRYSVLFSAHYEMMEDDAESYREMMDSQKDYEHE
jgi:hypothetical protein